MPPLLNLLGIPFLSQACLQFLRTVLQLLKYLRLLEILLVIRMMPIQVIKELVMPVGRAEELVAEGVLMVLA